MPLILEAQIPEQPIPRATATRRLTLMLKANVRTLALRMGLSCQSDNLWTGLHGHVFCPRSQGEACGTGSESRGRGDMLDVRTAFLEGWCLGNGTAADDSLARWRHEGNTNYYQVAHTMQTRPCFRARGGTCILVQPCPFRPETDGQGPHANGPRRGRRLHEYVCSAPEDTSIYLSSPNAHSEFLALPRVLTTVATHLRPLGPCLPHLPRANRRSAWSP
jgi:hypothetical protein